MGDITKNFSEHEFSCKCGCGFDSINKGLVVELQKVRSMTGQPMSINSGCRCESHNKSIPRASKSSSHMKGLAVDIKCDDSAYRSLLLPLLISRFARVGIGSDFIHIDVDSDKSQNVIWVY